ncbi:MAG: hypothetical protein AABX07_05720 [Nanoarchaeota archaeon]
MDEEIESEFKQEEILAEPPGKNWALRIFGIIVILSIIGIGVYYLIEYLPHSKISETQLTQGYMTSISENKKINFELLNEDHSIVLNSVEGNAVEITISSNPITVTLKVAEEKKFDLNGDGAYDLAVKLNSIDNGKPNLTIKKIYEPVSQTQNTNTNNQNNPSNQKCVENWNCGSWSTCQSNQQTRDCSDSNNCGTVNNKPSVSQSCSNTNTEITCTEDWNCGSWSTCNSNLQTRTCTDTSSCGTVNNKPSVSQSCTTESTCLVQMVLPALFRCNANGFTIEQKWQNADCSTTWKESSNCSTNYKCRITTNGVSCDLKSCTELGGSICGITQKCLNNNIITAQDSYACCKSSCQEKTCSERNGNICSSGKTCSSTTFTAFDTTECCGGSCYQTCNSNQLKSIADADIASNSYWSGFSDIVYNSYTFKPEFVDAWNFIYCGTGKTSGGIYQLSIYFSQESCNNIYGHGYVIDSLNGHLC